MPAVMAERVRRAVEDGGATVDKGPEVQTVGLEVNTDASSSITTTANNVFTNMKNGLIKKLEELPSK